MFRPHVLKSLAKRLFTRSFRHRPTTTRKSTLRVEAYEDRVVPTLCCGDFLTYTQGGWGAVPNGNNPGTYLHANFAAAFPGGLQIGSQSPGAAADSNTSAGNQSALFTSAQALTDWLPHGGPSGPLGGDTVDPDHPSEPDDGTLAGQAVALTLNLGFDDSDPDFSPSDEDMGGLIVTTGPFAGQTAQFVLDTANAILSGVTTTGYSAADANAAATAINENFDNGSANGGTDNGFLECAECDPNDPDATGIRGTKWEDLDGSAATTDDRPNGIGGITIFVDVNVNGLNDEAAYSTVTEADGTYSISGLPVGTYTVYEVVPSGYTAVGATSVGDVTVVQNTFTTGIDFANFENIDISGNKFYDRNTNGVDDGATEEGVAGVRMFLDADADGLFDDGEAFTFTDAAGNYAFTNLGPGTYTVREDTSVLPGLWVQITTNPDPIVASSGTDVANVDFGNVKLVGSGGLTIGFWGNKNGLALLSQADFAGLTALNLRNANGSARDFTGTLAQNKSALDGWLKNATATNMAYMLSAQLAATYLNTTVDLKPAQAGVQTAIPTTGGMIYLPAVVAHNPQGAALEGNLNGGPNPALVNANHQVSIADIIAAANAALGADGDVGAGDAARPYYEALKIVLDALNNNDAIVIA